MQLQDAPQEEDCPPTPTHLVHPAPQPQSTQGVGGTSPNICSGHTEEGVRVIVGVSVTVT